MGFKRELEPGLKIPILKKLKWQVSAVNHSEEHKLGIREMANVKG